MKNCLVLKRINGLKNSGFQKKIIIGSRALIRVLTVSHCVEHQENLLLHDYLAVDEGDVEFV